MACTEHISQSLNSRLSVCWFTSHLCQNARFSKNGIGCAPAPYAVCLSECRGTAEITREVRAWAIEVSSWSFRIARECRTKSLIAYLKHPQSKTGVLDVRIDCDAVRPTRLAAAPAGRLLGLQIADAVAGSFWSAPEQSKYDSNEHRYGWIEGACK